MKYQYFYSTDMVLLSEIQIEDIPILISLVELFLNNSTAHLFKSHLKKYSSAVVTKSLFDKIYPTLSASCVLINIT